MHFRILSMISLVVLLFSLNACDSPAKKKPGFSINTTSKDFGLVNIGSSSTPFTFTITNIGNAMLSVSSISFTGSNPNDFSKNAILPLYIAVGSNVSFTVTFTPNSQGVRYSTMAISHNANGSPSNIYLTGTGNTSSFPLFSISPTSKNFGSVNVGSSSSPATFTISNSGNANLSVTNFSISGSNSSQFTLTTSVPMNISAGSSNQFTVKFNPTSSGYKSANLSITHNANGSPANVPLSGTGGSNPTPTIIFQDDFSTNKGWTKNNISGTHQWFRTSGSGTHPNWPGASGNVTGGSGYFITSDADKAGFGSLNNGFISSPLINCTIYNTGTITLKFKGNFQMVPGGYDDWGRVTVYDGVNIHIIATYRSNWNTNGEQKQYNVSNYLRGKSNTIISFYYTGEFDWFFQVDDVELIHNP